jgi:type I restriction enzyme S subunit
MSNKTNTARPQKPLSEVVDINPRLDKAAYRDNLEVSFVPMAAVEAGSGQMEVSQAKPFATVKKGYTPFLEGDVLFAKITPCMENGKIAVVPKLINGLGFGSTEFHVLRPHEGIDPQYVYYFVSAQGFRREAAHHMTGAVGQKRVPQSFLEEASIPVPLFEEQRRIVAEIEKQFSRLDEAVTSLKRAKANLKRYKAAVLKAAVEGKLTEEWRKQHPDVERASKLLERILAERRAKWNSRGRYKEPAKSNTNDLPSLPTNWTCAPVESFLIEPMCNGISIKGSMTPPGVPALRLSAMAEKGFDYGEVRYIPIDRALAKELEVKEGDFFVSRGSGSLRLVGKGTVAQTPHRQCVFPDTMIRLRMAVGMGASRWISTIWPAELIRRQIEKRVKTTAGIWKISQPELGSILLPIPPEAEQHHIVAQVERRLSVIDELETSVEANLTRADRLRQSVLQRAFRGEL